MLSLSVTRPSSIPPASQTARIGQPTDLFASSDHLHVAGTVEKASVDEAYLDVTEGAYEELRLAESECDGGEEDRAARISPNATGSHVYGKLDLEMEGDCLLAVCTLERLHPRSSSRTLLSFSPPPPSPFSPPSSLPLSASEFFYSNFTLFLYQPLVDSAFLTRTVHQKNL
jgi:hypothetical protein